MIFPWRHKSGSSAGRDHGLWPVLFLLLVVILVPTAGVLWFMSKAVENERLASRQKLAEAYRSHLAITQERLENHWKEVLDTLQRLGETNLASAVFSRCVRSGLADSAICYDRRGNLAYPRPPQIPKAVPGERLASWDRARRLENRDKDFLAAAQAYGAIAGSAVGRDEAARALQAQARCLLRAGQKGAVVKLVTDTLGGDRYSRATDQQGRLVVADAELMALQLVGTAEDPRLLPLARGLRNRLLDYDNPALSAGQRRFLMKQMQALPVPAALKDFPTLEAEELAMRFLESNQAPPAEPVVSESALPGICQLPSRDGRVLALFRRENLIARLNAFSGSLGAPAEVTVAVVPPGEEPRPDAYFHLLPAGNHLPGWQLALSLSSPQALDATTERQVALYLWIGALVIAAMSALALLIAGAIRRQVRLARLKNDLVANVTHELKTPLSSVRLLVDTLLDEEHLDPQRVREYLQLIAKENVRLSRLIDNFLAFSRMERNKQAFELSVVDPAVIVHGAVEAIRERFDVPGCRFEFEIANELPSVVADADALVTVILNLLDNAYKYSGQDKRIALRVYPENESVCFAVEDNGIGLSPRDSKRVFKRFFQADLSLSRTAGGVGLGLSIVEFIVKAHGGSIHVESRLGHGSRFTVVIPAAPARSPAKEEALA